MIRDAFPVRLSHLLRECSVGAIVREKDRLVVVTDTSMWYRGRQPPESSELRYVDQVRGTLGITGRLCEPPAASISEGGSVKDGPGIPVVRFPKWTLCPRCRLLCNRPWADKRPDEPLLCRGWEGHDCRGRLEQVPWVIVHEDGYLSDVPWHRVAHSVERASPTRQDCAPDWNRPYLRLVERNGGIAVLCTRCNASSKLPRKCAFPPNQWRQPWTREPPPKDLEKPAWLIEINDVRLHGAVTRSALVIPPESRIRRGTVVDRLFSNTERQQEIREARPGLQRKSCLSRLGREWRCSAREIEDALAKIDRGYPLYGHTPEGRDIFRSEYRALTQPIPNVFEEEDFVTKHLTEDWKALGTKFSADSSTVISAVSRLIQVRRLREILVLQGFRRLNDGKVVPPDINGDAGWLPALGLRGEGVFITLEETMVQDWARQSSLQRRTEAVAEHCQSLSARNLPREAEISPRFILLHTLAHLLIRQFEAEAGYSAASIKERIYCSDAPDPMAGILIYVAVPDDIGSLGGLLELAEPGRFLRTFASALEASGWCSLDPICSEHEGQGPGLLNRAACQACALVPDPSCQYGNVLLDRTYLKGNAEAGVASLLEYAVGKRDAEA